MLYLNIPTESQPAQIPEIITRQIQAGFVAFLLGSEAGEVTS